MGCDSFVMPVCGSVESGEPRSRMSYHENILLRTNGGRRGRDRKPDIVACSAWIVSGWVVMVWGTVLFRACWNTYFVYLALRTSALGMGQAVRLGKRNTLCCKSWMEMYFYLVLRFFIFYLLFIIFCVLNFFRITKWWWLRWVSAVDLVGESPKCWSTCNIWGKMREGGEDDGKGMVSVIEGVQSLGGREMSSPMRDGIVLKYEKEINRLKQNDFFFF